jgi:hypothetical protein
MTDNLAAALRQFHMDIWRNGCLLCGRHHMPWWRSAEPPSHTGPRGGIAQHISRPETR